MGSSRGSDGGKGMATDADGTWAARTVSFPASPRPQSWPAREEGSRDRLLQELREVRQRNEALRAALQELSEIHEATLTVLAATIDLRDREAAGHSQRVAAYTVRLAREIGIDGQTELEQLKRAALLHDIGKANIPDQILLKPGRLTEQEWRIVRSHPVMGYRMLRRIPFLEKAAELAYCHHERWDGTGYPRGLEGEEIPLGARLFAVADVFDALTSDRPYRTALDFDQATAEIARGRGTHFDPMVVDAFLRVPVDEWVRIRRNLAGSPAGDAGHKLDARPAGDDPVEKRGRLADGGLEVEGVKG